MRLGDGFYIPEPVVEQVHQPSFEDLRNEQLLVAISALKDALVDMPRPEVHVEAPDLTAIVQAVTGLKPGATSEDIAQAVVRELSPATSQHDTNEILGKLVKALEKLDFRMQASGGGGSVALANSNITDNPARQLGEVTVKNFPAAPASTEISNDVGNPIPVSGTVAVSNPTAATDVSLLAKEATQSQVLAAVDTLEVLTNTLVTATQALLTNAQLRASSVEVNPRERRSSGVLTVPAAITLTGTTTTSSAVVVPADGSSGFSAQAIVTTTPVWAGSIVTEYSTDSGLTWTATAWRQTITGRSANTLTQDLVVNNGSYTGALMRGSSGGATHYRVRLATQTAGSVQVSLATHQGVSAVFSNTVLDTRDVFQYLCSPAGGRVGFNATTDVISTNTNEQLLAAFRNPAGSGVDLTLYRVEFGGTNAGKIRRYRGGTLTPGTGQNPAANVNRGGGTNISVGQLYPGTRNLAGLLGTTATGGTLSKVTYVAASVDDLDVIDGTLTLRPGDLAYWTVQTGAGDAAFDIAWAQTAAAV